MQWIYEAGRNQGTRPRQEDDYRIVELDPELGIGELLLVLADGMGGHQGGAFASALAVDNFSEQYPLIAAPSIPERLERTLIEINRLMAYAAAHNPEELSGMGCTLLAVVLGATGLHWVSVGDSPLWLWQGKRLRRLNQDHAYRSVLARQVAAGEISITAAVRHKARNALMSAVTGEPLELVDLSRQAYILRQNDQILLASDGILTLRESEIAGVFDNLAPDSNPCVALLAAVAAHQRSSQDNTTVLWARPAPLPQPNHQSWWARLRGLLRS